MKIGDKVPAAQPATVAQGVTPHKAGSWLAQLERAWLNSWHGDQPAGQGAANEGHAKQGAVQTNLPAPGRTPARAAGADERQAAGRDADQGARLATLPSVDLANPMIRHEQAVSPVLKAQPAAARAGSEVEHSTSVSAPPISAAKAMPIAQLRAHVPASAHEAGIETEATLPARTTPDQAPGTAPARTSLQVAVAQDTAQVTLRDASLSTTEASRISQSMAHQLLETGLASVRLYVNGQVSQHERSATDRSSSRKTSDLSAAADSLHTINPLERK